MKTKRPSFLSSNLTLFFQCNQYFTVTPKFAVQSLKTRLNSFKVIITTMNLFIMENRKNRERLLERCYSKFKLLKPTNISNTMTQTAIKSSAKIPSNRTTKDQCVNHNPVLKVVYKSPFLLSKLKSNASKRFYRAKLSGNNTRRASSQQDINCIWKNKHKKIQESRVTTLNIQFDSTKSENSPKRNNIDKQKTQVGPFRTSIMMEFLNLKEKKIEDPIQRYIETERNLGMEFGSRIFIEEQRPQKIQRKHKHLSRVSSAIFPYRNYKKRNDRKEVQSQKIDEIEFKGWDIDDDIQEL